MFTIYILTMIHLYTKTKKNVIPNAIRAFNISSTIVKQVINSKSLWKKDFLGIVPFVPTPLKGAFGRIFTVAFKI